MNLNFEKWRKVPFGNLFSKEDIYKAKAYTKEELEIQKYPTADSLSYVTRTEPNNSVEAFVVNNNLEFIEAGNALVVGDTTATVSYQKYPFVAGDHIVVIRPKWLNELNGLFFETLLNKERFRYSYGRAFIKDLIKDTILFIPYKDDKPDFEMMEKIIKGLKYKSITTKNKIQNVSIEFYNWKIFKIGDLFNKSDVPKHSCIPESEGDIPFISSTGFNNGVTSYVNEDSVPGNCITVSTNGGCFDCFYHDEPIVISSDVEILYSDFLNKSIAIFICTVLQQEKYKWSYGRKPKNNKVFETKILLPALHDENNNIIIDAEKRYSKNGYIPDFNYMERYIKNLPYGDKL